MAVFTLCRYLHQQWRAIPQPTAVDDVRSKTFLVTGSNVGLGFEASVHLAKMQPKLLIATSRNMAKCEKTRKNILERIVAGGIPSIQLYAWPLELESFQNVRSFVDKFAADGNGMLNVLVMNAGVFAADSYVQTQDGWEVICSPDAPSRLVVVSSFAHYFAPELRVSDSRRSILEAVNQPEFGNSFIRYQVSKLLGIMFIRELASRLSEPTPVIACAVDPGFCNSNITRHQANQWVISTFQRLAFVRSTEEGSRTLVHAAVASDRSMHGRYLTCCETSEESDFLLTPRGKACSARVWDETVAFLSGVDSRVAEVVERFL